MGIIQESKNTYKPVRAPSPPDLFHMYQMFHMFPMFPVWGRLTKAHQAHQVLLVPWG